MVDQAQKINEMSQAKRKHAIKEFLEIRRKYAMTPVDFRYVCREIRRIENLRIPNKRRKLPDFLNAAEVYSLLEVSKETPFDNLLIEFLIKTGLRINEATELTVDNIDFGNNQLKVVNGKGGKDRYVPIAQSLQRRLLTYLNGRKDGYLFCKSDLRQYSKRSLQRKVEFWLKRPGFSKKLSTHSLRHTFGCLCIARGLSLESIQIIMGHSSKKTTELYAHLELGSIKEQYLQIMEN